jgi:P-type Ca2+ transporter type 2C
MVLADDDFSTLRAAIEEGRRVYDNLVKALAFILPTSAGQALIIAVAVLAFPADGGAPVLPVEPVQILWINLIVAVALALPLALEAPEPDLMRRPPRDRDTGIFTRPVIALIVTGGIASGIITFGLFLWALSTDRVLAEAMTMVFATLVLIEFFKAFSYRSDRHSVLARPFANKWLNLAILWELTLLVLVINVPFLQDAFGTTTLALVEWALVTGLAFLIIPVLEVAKWRIRRMGLHEPS